MRIFKLTLHVWRQKNRQDSGGFETHQMNDVNEHMSFLEMLDLLNERLIEQGREPIAFDHDCREGICGSCGIVINGVAHGPKRATTTCQLHMRHFKDGEELWLEPWRADAFPVVRDLVVDRGAFDRIIQAGGFISVRSGSPRDANEILVPKQDSDASFDAAACIACGACVAACPNASASLYVSAKISHLNLLPQGKPEAARRVLSMVEQHDREGFGGCTQHGECEKVCPKSISIRFIAKMNADYLRASLGYHEEKSQGGDG